MEAPATYPNGYPHRCTCCDGTPDGLGVYHLSDPDQLRAWLTSPYREDGIGVDVMLGRIEMVFENAYEAEMWLLCYDERRKAEARREWTLEHSGRGGRI